MADGGYDLVVNNAGFGVYGQFAKVPVETYQRIVDLNCRAVLAICHAYLTVARSGDALVNVNHTIRHEVQKCIPGRSLLLRDSFDRHDCGQSTVQQPFVQRK